MNKIVQSFSYCGITSYTGYYSQLTEQLNCHVMLSQKTVVPRGQYKEMNLNHLIIKLDYHDDDENDKISRNNENIVELEKK